MTDERKIRDAADAVRGLVEAVPVYEDVLQPALREIGTGLQTLAKAVHIVLTPVSALVWGFDQIRGFVLTKVTERLRATPPENLVAPAPNVAGPALEALRYTGHQESLRDLYANLLAASMDKATAQQAHPAFVEVIKQLTPDEAKLLRLFTHSRRFPIIDLRSTAKDGSGFTSVLVHFSTLGEESGSDVPENTPAYLDNLCRLGLAEIPADAHYSATDAYDDLRSHPKVVELSALIATDPAKTADIDRQLLRLTPFGQQFCRICVIDHAEQAQRE